MPDGGADIPGILFDVAGASLAVHFAACFMTYRRLSSHRDLADALFGVPNRPLGTPDGIRLLRFRYFFPSRYIPGELLSLGIDVRLSLAMARLSGFCFLCAALGFLAWPFVIASR
jgi:hypothetical protein